MLLNRNIKNIAVFAMLMAVALTVVAGGCRRSIKKVVPGAPKMPVERPIKQTGKEKWMEWNSITFGRAKKENKLLLVCMSPWETGYSQCNEIMESTSLKLKKKVKNEGFIPLFVDEDRRPDIYEAFSNGDCQNGYSALAFLLDPDGKIHTDISIGADNKINTVACTASHDGCNFKTTFNHRLPRINYVINGKTDNAADKDKGRLLNDVVVNIDECLSKRDKEKGFSDDVFTNILDYDQLNVLYLWLSSNRKLEKSRTLELAYNLLLGKYDSVWGGVFARSSPSGDLKSKHLLENAQAIRIFLSNHQSLRDEQSDSGKAEEILKYAMDFLSAPGGGFRVGQASDLNGPDGKLMTGNSFYSLKDEQRRKIGMPELNKAVLTVGNSEMVSALLKAADVLDRDDLRNKGLETLDFILKNGWSAERGAAHYIENGKPYLFELLNDDVGLLTALIDAYEATGNNDYLKKAVLFVDFLDEHFWDSKRGFYRYSVTLDPILKRLLEDKFNDEANMKAAIAINSLYHITGEEKYEKKAEALVLSFKEHYLPCGVGGCVPAIYIEAAYRQAANPMKIAVIGPKSDPMTAALRHEARKFYEPLKFVITLDPKEDAGWLAKLPYSARPRPTLYACVETACSMPVQDPKMVERQMRRFDDRFMGKKQYERIF